MVESVSTLLPPSAPEIHTGSSTIMLTPSVESLDVDSIRLGEGRHCVGADPTCDVVLSCSGIADRHCLIVVGPRRTVVKALSPLTWINDGPVREDPLRVGDRLTLGPIEFHVGGGPVSESSQSTVPAELPAALRELLDEAEARRELHTAAAAAAVTHEMPDEDVANEIAERVRDDDRFTALAASSNSLELDFAHPVAPQELALPETGLVDEVADRSREDHPGATVHRPISRDALFAEREAIEQSRSALQQQREYLAQLAESLDKRDRDLSRRHADISDSQEKLGQKQLRLTDWETRLNEDRRDLTQERTTLRADGERLAGERNRIQGELAELRRQRDSLVQREETLRIQSEQLAQAHAEQDSREQELSARSLSLQAEVAGVKQDRTELKGARAALDQERETLDSERRAIEDRKNSLNDEQQALSAAKAALRSEEERLQEQIQNVACQEEQLAHDRAHMGQLERGNEAERDALEAERKEAARDHEALRLERAEIEEARAALNSERAELEELSQRAAREREELEIERQTLVEQRSALVEQEQLTEASRIRSAEEQEALHQEEARLNEQRQTWERDLSAHESRCQQLDQQLDEIQQHRRAVESEREGLEQSRAALAGEQAALESEREELSRRREQLEQREAELSESTATHGTLRESFEQERERLEEERDAIRRDREAIVEHQRALEAEREALAADRTPAVEDDEHTAQAESLAAEQTRLEEEREAVQRDRQLLLEEQRAVEDSRQSLETERELLAQQREAWEREQQATESEPAVDDIPTYEFSVEQQQPAQLWSEPDTGPDSAAIDSNPETNEVDPAEGDSRFGWNEPESAAGSFPEPADSFATTADHLDAEPIESDEPEDQRIAGLRGQLADLFGAYSTERPREDESDGDVDAPDQDAQNEQMVDLVDEQTDTGLAPELLESNPASITESDGNEFPTEDEADDHVAAPIFDASEAIIETPVTADIEMPVTADEDQEPGQVPEVPVDETVPASISESTASGDSIAAYMERLLGRSNRTEAMERARPVSQHAAPAPRPAEKNGPSAETDPGSAQPAAKIGDAGHDRRNSAEVPKDLMRENLASFRELANMSARTAVAQHASKRLWSTVQMKVALTGVALALTAMLIAAHLMGMGSYLIGSAVTGFITIVLAAELIRTLVCFYRWQSVESAEGWSEQVQDGPDATDSEEVVAGDSTETIELTLLTDGAGEQAETDPRDEIESADAEDPESILR